MSLLQERIEVMRGESSNDVGYFENNACEYYSIVISKLNDIWKEEILLAKDEEGDYLCGSNFDINDRLGSLVYSWQRNETIKLTESQKTAVDKLTFFLNNTPSVLMFHDGDDDLCKSKFPGRHIHIISNLIKPCDQRKYKNLASALRQAGTVMKSEKIRNIDDMLRYFLKAPRQIHGCNNMELLAMQISVARSVQLIDEENFDETLLDLSKLYQPLFTVQEPKDKNLYQKNVGLECVKELVSLFDKYNACSLAELRKIAGETENEALQDQVTVLYLKNICGKIEEDALFRLYSSKKFRTKTYLDIFMENEHKEEGRLGFEDTKKLFLNWCKYQEINPGDFVLKVYLVLGQKLNKINTICFHGDSNAGKTYWSYGFFPDELNNLKGQLFNSETFSLSLCVNKKIVFIKEMQVITKDKLEELKQVFEGEPLPVNIKNRGAEYIYRTPVIINTNTLPWEHHEKEEQAFRNRMFGFFNLEAISSLDPDRDKPNSNFFRDLFSEIKMIIKEKEINEKKLFPLTREYMDIKFMINEYLSDDNVDLSDDNKLIINEDNQPILEPPAKKMKLEQAPELDKKKEEEPKEKNPRRPWNIYDVEKMIEKKTREEDLAKIYEDYSRGGHDEFNDIEENGRTLYHWNTEYSMYKQKDDIDSLNRRLRTFRGGIDKLAEIIAIYRWYNGYE